MTKQAEGFKELVEVAGHDPQSAIGYLMIDKLTEMAKIQTGAIIDLDIDKVVVYDNGSGQGVSNFVQGLYGMMPQLNDFLKQSGMNLPDSLVRLDNEQESTSKKKLESTSSKDSKES